MNEKKVTVFLNNGFRYTGTELSRDDTFITVTDDKDGKTRSFPLTNVTTIEEVEE